MIRCRADAILESQDFFTGLGETAPSSSRHLLSHNNTKQLTTAHWCIHSSEIKPHYHVGLCLFIAIVLYYIVGHEWALLSYLMMGKFLPADTWARKGSDDKRYPSEKHLCVSSSPHTHTQTHTRMQQDRTTKLEGWNSRCMSSLRRISQHFLLALL